MKCNVCNGHCTDNLTGRERQIGWRYSCLNCGRKYDYKKMLYEPEMRVFADYTNYDNIYPLNESINKY